MGIISRSEGLPYLVVALHDNLAVPVQRSTWSPYTGIVECLLTVRLDSRQNPMQRKSRNEGNGSSRSPSPQSLRTFLSLNAALEVRQLSEYLGNAAEGAAAAPLQKDGVAHPFPALRLPFPERDFLRLFSHRIPLETVAAITGLEQSTVDEMVGRVLHWLESADPEGAHASAVQIGVDLPAGELGCPVCDATETVTFYGVSWHRMPIYQCMACSSLFAANQATVPFSPSVYPAEEHAFV